MIIRWLNAFRGGRQFSLGESLQFELAQTAGERAAEIIPPGRSSGMPRHVQVGLQLDREAVVRRFNSDVWSEPDGSGFLKPTRCQREYSRHQEAFCLPRYRRIVLKGHPSRMKKADLAAVMAASKIFSLPVVYLHRGRLLEVSM